ncbi:HupE/UreJ family protein [Enterovirga aerilata]|uniref:HupE/UreJ family protein n=1 Tax=Enterovirga aerilata TaxID=2730920 RepID=A0A849IC96_9HYPH|nr:HupE/UreJ family protein [Enterovirga sp. DB1703]NNM73597.1 HupE/UreJ family protein [Enterovirga sp. DB1703]
MSRIALWAALGLVSGAGPALAHTGFGGVSGFGHGFSHPFGGADHVLAMVAVGLMAAQLGGRALWALPLAFLSMMTIGGALGLAGFELPYVELGIGLSVVAFGLAIALRADAPLALATALIGAFALFHGHAHGAEMPDTASGLAYGAGFVVATAILHAAGIAIGLMLGRLSAPRILRAAGGAIALAGVAILGKLV